jgi:hypothetical protein
LSGHVGGVAQSGLHCRFQLCTISTSSHSGDSTVLVHLYKAQKQAPGKPNYYYTFIFTSIQGESSIVLFICSAISSSAKCLRVSKTESYRLGRICFEMTCQATMPLSSEKCLRVSKTESYSLSRICFEMTRQATMPSSKA